MRALGFGWRRTTAVTSYWDRLLDDAEAEDEAASGSFVATDDRLLCGDRCRFHI